jgi:ATP/maltotriose-dependent transcriptional regulator MalT
LSRADQALGQWEEARQHARRTGELAQALQDDWLLADGLLEWGVSLCALGDVTHARTLFQRSFSLREDFGDPQGMALALAHLGRAALLERDLSTAQSCYRESYTLYNDLADQGGLATALTGLGDCALAAGRLAEARTALLHALTLVETIPDVPLRLTILLSAADLLREAGQADSRQTALRWVRQHPLSTAALRRLAEEKMTPASPLAAAAENPAGPAAGDGPEPAQNLDELVKRLRAAVAALPPGALLKAVGNPPAAAAENAGADEWGAALTRREVEILRAMQEGLSNQQTADRLDLSLGALQWYTRRIYARLNVASRAQAVTQAQRLGWL